jgi:hypothetical protein
MTDTERLMALEEIKQVKARYFRCMDTKDWAGFEAVFTPDATADYSSEGDAREWSAAGAAKVVSLVRKAVEPAVTIHHGHMAEVEVLSANTARGIFAMEDLIWWPAGSRRKTLHGWGHYHETYEKVGGKWLIKTLKLTRLRVEET